MTEYHPITPPPELVQQWGADWYRSKEEHLELEPYLVAKAAQWGADQELDACCEWIPKATPWDAEQLRAARRPEPPSLKPRTNNQTDWRELCVQLYAALEAHGTTWSDEVLLDRVGTALRLAQPEPESPSLKEEALAALHGADDQGLTHEHVVTIRRALEQLDD